MKTETKKKGLQWRAESTLKTCMREEERRQQLQRYVQDMSYRRDVEDMKNELLIKPRHHLLRAMRDFKKSQALDRQEERAREMFLRLERTFR